MGASNWRRVQAYSEREIKRPLRDAHRLRAHAGPRHVERLHGGDEAGAFAPQAVLDRHAAILEDQLARGGGANAELVFLLAEAESRRALLDHDAGGAARALGGIGERDDGINLRFAAVGDPLLGAVEHVVVAVAEGGGADGRGVRARLRLGEREGRELLARGNVGQPALLLLVAAGEDDGNCAQRRPRETPARCPRRPCESSSVTITMFMMGVPSVRPSYFVVNEDAEEIGVRQDLHDRPGELGVAVVFGGDGADFLLGDLARQVANGTFGIR